LDRQFLGYKNTGIDPVFLLTGTKNWKKDFDMTTKAFVARDYDELSAGFGEIGRRFSPSGWPIYSERCSFAKDILLGEDRQ
jgi:hypothetical protein